MSRAQTSVSKRKETKLPGLSKPRSFNKATLEEIQRIKLLTQQMELEKRQLRSKTSRMKQILHDRNTAINQVLSEGNENAKIKTASGTTISQLKANLQTLKNTLTSRQQELENLRKNDKLAVSDELQVELQMYYLEHKRLKIQSKAVKEGETVITTELDRLKYEIGQRKAHQNAIASLQEDLSSLIDKLVAYRKSALRIEAAELSLYLNKNPKHIDSKEKQLNNEINQIVEETDKIREETNKIHEEDQNTYEELRKVIDEQRDLIAQAVSKLNRSEEDEEKEEIQNEDRSQNDENNSVFETTEASHAKDAAVEEEESN